MAARAVTPGGSLGGVPLLPDPGPARFVAGRLHDEADTLRRIAIRIALVGSVARWESAAGAAFRGRLHDTAARAQRCARQLDTAAEIVGRHADRLASLAAELADGQR
jgi:hypothetical protein